MVRRRAAYTHDTPAQPTTIITINHINDLALQTSCSVITVTMNHAYQQRWRAVLLGAAMFSAMPAIRN